MRSSTDFQLTTETPRLSRVQVLRDGEYFGTFDDAKVLSDPDHGAVYCLEHGGLVEHIAHTAFSAASFRVIYPDGTFIELELEVIGFEGQARRCDRLKLLYVGQHIDCGELRGAFRL